MRFQKKKHAPTLGSSKLTHSRQPLPWSPRHTIVSQRSPSLSLNQQRCRSPFYTPKLTHTSHSLRHPTSNPDTAAALRHLQRSRRIQHAREQHLQSKHTSRRLRGSLLQHMLFRAPVLHPSLLVFLRRMRRQPGTYVHISQKKTKDLSFRRR